MKHKIVRNRFNLLLAEKAYREGRPNIPRREVIEATGLVKSTIDRIAKNELTMYDNKVVIALCDYFGCSVGDLLVIEEIEEPSMLERSFQPA